MQFANTSLRNIFLMSNQKAFSIWIGNIKGYSFSKKTHICSDKCRTF